MDSGGQETHRFRFDAPAPSPRPPMDPAASPPRDPLTSAITRTRDWLLAQQADEGYWVGELEGDSILQSEYILLLAWLNTHDDAPEWLPERIRRLANRLHRQQLPGGGWSLFPGGPLEISGSVKAYLAMKIAGASPDAPGMQRARRAILSAGGAEQINSFTRYYLALLGILRYDQCPAVPPELVLIPHWVPLNIYDMSAWSRTIFVPLSLLWAFQPSLETPQSWRIDELFRESPETLPVSMPDSEQLDDMSRSTRINWSQLFRRFDAAWKRSEQWKLTPLRRTAIRRASEWMIERFAGSDGLGAIFPPMVWSVIALKCLGYSCQSPILASAIEELEQLVIGEEDTDRLQPCKSPVWDTSLSIIALRESGLPAEHPSLRAASHWLLEQEIRQPGDWSLGRSGESPTGWCFEFNNRFYPDIDDTAMAVLALVRCLPELPWTADFFLDNDPTRGSNLDPGTILAGRTLAPREANETIEAMQPLLAAIQRGAHWVLGMQSRDGGWGAFDVNNDREILTRVPFADHNAMIDPSTADLTARVLEMLGGLGTAETHPAVVKALEFIWNSREEDDCWYGRWGVNYIYGTWQTLLGLNAIGVPRGDSRVRAAARWLVDHQHPSGGWGESPRTYDDPSLRGSGPTTASQTAWAIMGLLAAGHADSEAVERGIRFLLSTQERNGTWSEPWFTGTGFPRVFYLKYHLYPVYFPLMALGRYAKARRSRQQARHTA